MTKKIPKEINTTKEELSYVNPFIRGGAAAIDVFIVAILRMIFAQIVGKLWVEGKIIQFYVDFDKKFGVQFSGINQDHIQFLMDHQIVWVVLSFALMIIMVGAIYHAYLNSSTWSATVGKRILGVILVKNEGKYLTFGQALWHYALSLVPWIFMLYLLLFQLKQKVTIYEALNNPFNLALGIITLLWIQVHILTKKRNTVQDMVIGCTMVKGRIGTKWPKFRTKKTK